MRKTILTARDLERAVAAAADRQAAAAKVQALEPTWADLKAEGVIDHIPEPGPDGKFEVPANGVKYLKMRERALKAEADLADGIYASTPTVKIRGRNGETQRVPESQAERRERKHFKPRAMFTVPEMPWHREKA